MEQFQTNPNNQNDISSDGTKLSGYVTKSQNKPPRQCGNCIWAAFDTCGHPVVIRDPELKPRLTDGRVPIDDDACCNGFQSRGNVVLYLVRHGETEFNKSQSFRGWIDVDLNELGKKQAQAVGSFFSGKNFKAVYSSDLDRSLDTAKIALGSNKKVYKDKNLRPWDVGIFSGKPRDVNQEKLNKYIDNPEIAIPDGESLKEFADRSKKSFIKYLKESRNLGGPVLLFFHSSNCIQFEKQAEGKDEYGRPEDVDRVGPGGVMAILEEDGVFKAEVIFGGTGVANYGS